MYGNSCAMAREFGAFGTCDQDVQEMFVWCIGDPEYLHRVAGSGGQMQLVKAQVLNFCSVVDSGVFEVGDMTCLVGKNEAGKPAILRAIQGIKPSVAADRLNRQCLIY
ncbi:MAG: hypothetical protein JSS44_01180 [Proteobacteria bacterium]|nr:hypothetical protein [Pseudomonadota bacterium]